MADNQQRRHVCTRSLEKEPGERTMCNSCDGSDKSCPHYTESPFREPKLGYEPRMRHPKTTRRPVEDQ